MARVRYLGHEQVTVPELGRTVEPDEIVDVPDERYWGYACQTTNWEEIEPPVDFVPPGSEPEREPEDQAEEPPAPKPAAKKTTVKTAKEG
ncbi:hypothetical protein AB0D38_02875 [Streptomyces sp. NPDC048279]|jgi:hypothetical protein|uniref:hypothetical protein n=1 Tax=Streptomyces sp. NPDC048279 TaxID=3154714 RepID=UPI003420322F